MNYFDSKYVVILIPTIYIIIGSIIFQLITVTEPTPYIDELFHVGQCQLFCQGVFNAYNPKITTPPGLYIISLLITTPLSYLNINLCTTVGLRFINFTASLLIIYLLYQILKIQFHYSNIRSICIALNLTTFPLLYFYYFFYYTDILSTVFVLLIWYFYKTNHSHLAGIAGFISVTIRQTNLLWFFYFAAIKCYENLETDAINSGRDATDEERREFFYVKVVVNDFLCLVGELQFKKLINLIIKETYIFILTSLCFLCFFLTNGSVVLGDKSAHKLSLHLPQLFYFAVFTSIFSFPMCIRPVITLLKNFRAVKTYFCIPLLFIARIVAVNTMTHLYLISDNRHYTFYIWKRIFEKPLGKYTLIPAYIVGTFCIIENTMHVDSFVKSTYIVAIMFSLVPEKLLEFRYFIIPYLIYRIESSPKLLPWHLWLEFLFNVFINYLTISVFLLHPFEWADGSVQRFSW